VLNNARKKVEGKRHKFEYKCAACGGWFKAREVQVDHLIDAGSLKDYTDLPGFVERLFTSEDMLQVLCKSCHSSKTQKARNEKRTS
jgi:5-methylcytosine-specific restriction endonuclease McrA